MWIPISEEEAPELIAKLRAGGLKAMADKINSALQEAKNKDTQKLIDAANEKYATCNDDNEINVDDDAAISASDEHAFVMMWGCVTYKEAGIDTDDDTDTDDDD